MNADELRERYARQSTCTHPQITHAVVEQAHRNAYKWADSNATYLTCPDCGLQGDAEVDMDTDTVVLLDEPRGAGNDYPW